MKPTVKRIRRRLSLSAVALVLMAAAGCLYLRLDKTHVFDHVRGDYRGVGVLESWRTETSEVRLIELLNHRGEAPLTAFVRRPFALAADYRVICVYAGVKTRRKILDLIPERPDVVLVAPQYPRIDARGVWQSLRLPLAVRQAAYRTVAGGMLATSFLERTETLDPGRMTVIGSSVGSAFATLHGALDERVARVVLIHGGGDFPAIIRFLERGRGRRWQGEAKALLAAVFVDTFDPVHWVDRIAPRELILIGARDDSYFPTASTLELYTRAREPKRLIWTDTGHVRSRKTQTLDRVLALVDEHTGAESAD